jgi:hypothetical protein
MPFSKLVNDNDRLQITYLELHKPLQSGKVHVTCVAVSSEKEGGPMGLSFITSHPNAHFRFTSHELSVAVRIFKAQHEYFATIVTPHVNRLVKRSPTNPYQKTLCCEGSQVTCRSNAPYH